MVAARAKANGLSAVDLDQIRGTLAAGRRPKVVFTSAAGQVAGQLGQVVALTDPAVSDDWLVVRFGRDELPFSPADLAIPARSVPAGSPSTLPAPREETPVPAPSLPPSKAPSKRVGRPPRSAADRAATDGAGPDKAAPDRAATDGAGPDKAAPDPDQATPGKATPERPAKDTAAPETAAPAQTSPSVEQSPVERRTPPRRQGRPKPPASLTVTLAYAEGEWTVGATQGSKALAKPYVIKAGEALKMVAMLDVPGVHEAVEEIVAAARTEAELHAERLRAELAELEARLAELRDVS